ncbi:hypothetical protein GS909_07890 [Rhodococcus hoagii]|nr:hypothetical protein [Prescottella equi]NKV11052.1 hypothetical protein [Prescottella equi]
MTDYVWKLEIEYPEGAVYPDDAPEWYAGCLRSDWAPKGWDPDDDYIDRFQTERFIWPTVRKFYLSRSAAVDRAHLLESYGARARLLRSAPLTFEERRFKRPLRLIEGGAA